MSCSSEARICTCTPLANNHSRSARFHGVAGQALPTAKQWETLAALASRAGWSGLEDFRLLSFARHTAKVVELGELSRAAMSKVISGLSRMLAQHAHTGEVGHA